MGKNGRQRNDIDRRLAKLEAGFNELIECLHSTAQHILIDCHDDELTRLLKTPGATEVNRLCNLLRKMASDAKEPPSRRLASGLAAAAIELRHSVQGR